MLRDTQKTGNFMQHEWIVLCAFIVYLQVPLQVGSYMRLLSRLLPEHFLFCMYSSQQYVCNKFFVFLAEVNIPMTVGLEKVHGFTFGDSLDDHKRAKWKDFRERLRKVKYDCKGKT